MFISSVATERKAVIKPPPQPGGGALRDVDVHLFVCLSVRLFVCLSVSETLQPSRGAAATTGVPYVFSTVKNSSRAICACGGGLLVAPINALVFY